jgi:predicted HAD superfamily Cof-like phosphohydrolase
MKRPIDYINESYGLKGADNMNKQYEMVRDFQERMGQPFAETPTVMSNERRENRFEYMDEELLEFYDAKTVVDQADAMIDLIYLAIGTLVELGVKPEPLFEIVHNANMSKIWPDGKARLNPETGKVVKPPGFIRPEPLLEAEIKRQSRRIEKRKLSDYHTETTIYLGEE